MVRVKNATIPDKLKVLVFEKYDGKLETDCHLWQFDSYLQVISDHENVIAKFFKGTLTQNAATWYNNLPDDNINSWDDLKKHFYAITSIMLSLK